MGKDTALHFVIVGYPLRFALRTDLPNTLKLSRIFVRVFVIGVKTEKTVEMIIQSVRTCCILHLSEGEDFVARVKTTRESYGVT